VPVPGTGPYTIAAYVPGKTFTLRRNPYFKQWSFAAQPAGYPETIDFRKVASGQAGAEAVVEGRADVAWVYPASAPLRANLESRYPDGDTTAPQFKEQVLAQSDFEYLNTSMAPFDDTRVRQALNYAVDRNRLAAIKGAGAGYGVTCQVLPLNFPSYRWYCPYTTGSPDAYHGPDLAKAMELVALSGTRGMTVTVQGLVGGCGPLAQPVLRLGSEGARLHGETSRADAERAARRSRPSSFWAPGADYLGTSVGRRLSGGLELVRRRLLVHDRDIGSGLVLQPAGGADGR